MEDLDCQTLKKQLVKIANSIQNTVEEENMTFQQALSALMILTADIACYHGLKKPHFLALLSNQWEEIERMIEKENNER